MLKIEIPGQRAFILEHLVLDYNGTMAIDGKQIPAVGDLLNQLENTLQVHILTADTFGTAGPHLKAISCRLVVLHGGRQDVLKRKYIEKIGTGKTVCIGNGRNDLLMIKKAALGIAVIQEEGAFVETVMKADVVCRSIVDALQLLINPQRLIATLRNG